MQNATAGAPKSGAPSSPHGCRHWVSRRATDRQIRPGQKNDDDILSPSPPTPTNSDSISIRGSAASSSDLGHLWHLHPPRQRRQAIIFFVFFTTNHGALLQIRVRSRQHLQPAADLQFPNQGSEIRGVLSRSNGAPSQSAMVAMIESLSPSPPPSFVTHCLPPQRKQQNPTGHLQTDSTKIQQLLLPFGDPIHKLKSQQQAMAA
ncbi:hypothetical protein ACLOJK_012560 [Asimina triloba]